MKKNRFWKMGFLAVSIFLSKEEAASIPRLSASLGMSRVTDSFNGVAFEGDMFDDAGRLRYVERFFNGSLAPLSNGMKKLSLLKIEAMWRGEFNENEIDGFMRQVAPSVIDHIEELACEDFCKRGIVLDLNHFMSEDLDVASSVNRVELLYAINRKIRRQREQHFSVFAARIGSEFVQLSDLALDGYKIENPVQLVDLDEGRIINILRTIGAQFRKARQSMEFLAKSDVRSMLVYHMLSQISADAFSIFENVQDTAIVKDLDTVFFTENGQQIDLSSIWGEVNDVIAASAIIGVLDPSLEGYAKRLPAIVRKGDGVTRGFPILILSKKPTLFFDKPVFDLPEDFSRYLVEIGAVNQGAPVTFQRDRNAEEILSSARRPQRNRLMEALPVRPAAQAPRVDTVRSIRPTGIVDMNDDVL